MNKLLLSLLGVAALTAFAAPAEARDHCRSYGYRSNYGYHRSYSYYPTTRVHYVSQPAYYRTYSRNYCAPQYRRVYYRSYDDGCRPRGLRGFIHGIFR